MDSLSYLSNADPGLVDNLYQQYKQNPKNVDITWQKFFEGFEFSKTTKSLLWQTRERQRQPRNPMEDFSRWMSE